MGNRLLEGIKNLMLKKSSTALIVIDVQGKLARIMQNADEYVANMRKLIRGAKVLNIPIIWTEQLPEKLGETIPEIADLLDGQKPFIKKEFSCWRDSDIQSALKNTGATQILVSGIETHVCVYQTAVDLLEAEYEVQVVADAVSSRTSFNRDMGLDKIILNGGSQTSVETALFELQEIAEGNNFRELIKIIK